MAIKLSRRHFIGLGAMGTFSLLPLGYRKVKSLFGTSKIKTIPGKIIGEPHHFGHLIRNEVDLSRFTGIEKRVGTLIVGGGVSGVSAGWKLKQAGVNDFLIVDLHEQAGGTSASGFGNGTAFPWGGHYVRTPTPEAVCIREVFSELGLFSKVKTGSWPRFKKEHLLREPESRLLQNGTWYAGVEPLVGASQQDMREFDEFWRDMVFWMEKKGRDGRRAFVTPLAYSSQDLDILKLDQITMAAYLQSKNWKSKRLHWYVNYGCLDDYGSTLDQVSAWAGIHYFCCRNYDEQLQSLANQPVETATWPQGNAFLIERLSAQFSPQNFLLGHLVVRIAVHKNDVQVLCLDKTGQNLVKYRAQTVVFAGQKNIANHVIKDLPPRYKKAFRAFSYSPWVTANVYLHAISQDMAKTLAWDNVGYQSDSLGYVVAHHQSPDENRNQKPTVITYYRPFKGDPDLQRQKLKQMDHASLAEMVVAELMQMHPDIEPVIQKVDICVWGHAMIRPRPGFIWSQEKAEASRPWGRILFAHSDLSGLPLFEEACFQGIRAAEAALAMQKITFRSSLH